MVNSRKSSPHPYIRSNSRRKSGMSTYHRRCSRRQREPCGYIRHKRRSSDSDIGSSPPGTPYCRDPCYKRWRNCCRLPPSILFYTSRFPSGHIILRLCGRREPHLKSAPHPQFSRSSADCGHRCILCFFHRKRPTGSRPDTRRSRSADIRRY